MNTLVDTINLMETHEEDGNKNAIDLIFTSFQSLIHNTLSSGSMQSINWLQVLPQ
jgi:hypothetical protein